MFIYFLNVVTSCLTENGDEMEEVMVKNWVPKTGSINAFCDCPIQLWRDCLNVNF